MKFESFGVINYPDYINVVSIYIGKLRDLYNAEMNLKEGKYRRGELSELVNILGIKGELVVQNFLFQHNVLFKYSPILSNKPVGEYDIIIDDKFRIDIKTINDGAEHLLVNEEAHKKKKNITHYWFVQPLVDMKGNSLTRANYWIYPYDAITQWEINKFKYTTAHFFEIKNIKNEK